MSAERVITLLQGEHAVTGDEAAVLVTVLGSCVAACLRDPVAGLGGMNHFLLPGGGTDARGAVKYGLHAMELLINALIRAGASRGRLEAKLFGGAQMLRGLPDIGRANAAFAEDFLRRERLRYLGGSLGGTQGRRIRFRPVSGRAQQWLIAATEEPAPLAVAPPPRGEIELF